MTNAIVLINVENYKLQDIAQKLVDIDEVSEVYSVGGRFDLVAIIRAKTNEAISDIVTEKFPTIEGIRTTETLIAFKVFSKHDLERMFAIGVE
ncbi:Lrp/AsnC family transcriptional regulator [Oceanidesulfovibrio marinus]|uniref:Lrp/AsnC family transcriptional regulator n=1 Tax=Oceanidesulfovibrio marinus TaxID=370038 RepID=A0A6P1ZI76_9BACT|nr:Lrp/AsnC ligand binding domain-containing protein [Oceanidesulfovibrio marinus]QJT08071.1 Lrp/AsnC family transcriptional regulator [Oceanidesulfovibrio marinus]TVM34887.1 Lrp/AsnC family transcriptional regulator [Oceanidesulfovibrio marinus]